MGLIKRYLLKAHIAPFVFGTLTVMFIFLFQFLLNFVDKLLGKGLETIVILQLISLSLPAMAVLAVPMGILFSTIMGFGNMSANQEITIIKSSGGSLIKMMIPFLFIGTIFSFVMFWFNDAVLPEANHQRQMLLNDVARKKPTFGLDKGQFSTQIPGLTILSRDIDSLTGAMKSVTIYDHTKPRLKNIINADSGFVKFDYKSSKMIMELYSGEIVQYVEHSVNNLKKIKFNHYTVSLEASGFALERTQKDENRSDREMVIADMQKEIDRANAQKIISLNRINKELQANFDYITCKSFPEKETNIRTKLAETQVAASRFTSLLNQSKNQNASSSVIPIKDTVLNALSAAENRIAMFKSLLYSDFAMVKISDRDERKYGVEIQKKYSIPVACLIFVLVGCPLGIRTKGGNFGLSAAYSLGFFVLYWACLIGGEKLADRAVISPFLGMWMGNIIVGTLGIILTLKENNENLNFKKILIGKFNKIFRAG